MTIKKLARVRTSASPIMHFVACSALPCAVFACQRTSDAPKTESAVVANDPNPTAPRIDSSAWHVNEFGYGPIIAGTTYAAANDSLKGALKTSKGADLAGCDYVKWKGGPPGFGVMVIGGKIARVDVRDSSTVATAEGAHIGDTEERIKSIYGNRVTVTKHKYEDGHYLTVRSANPTDTLHYVIFETANGKVTRFRAGAKPGVEYIEGCS